MKKETKKSNQLTTRSQRKQIRLDKAVRRNAKKLMKGNTARYY